MDIVGSRIAVDDLDRLAGHHAEHVRIVPAADLIERGGFLRDVEGAAAEAFLHVNEDVDEMAAAGDHGFGRSEERRVGKECRAEWWADDERIKMRLVRGVDA